MSRTDEGRSPSRALVLIDASIWAHPLMDAERLRRALGESNRKARAAVVGSMCADGDENAQPVGALATYRAGDSSRRRTEKVLRAVDRERHAAVVLVAWWVDEAELRAWSQRTGLPAECIAGLDAVDEVRLAQACIGAAMVTTEVLF